MKKCFAVFTLLCLSLGLLPSVQAIEPWTLRSELSYHEGGNEFISRVETILPEVRATSLMWLETKLSSLENLWSMEELQTMKIRYLSSEIKKELQHRSQDNSLSASEVQDIESEILALQKDFLSELENGFWELMSQVTESIGTREIWNLEGNFYYSLPFFGELEMNISLSDYIADTESLTSSRIRADIGFSLNMFDEKIQSSMNMDLITKENNIYLLVQNLEVLSESGMDEMLSEIIETVNTLGENNTYIHIWNSDGDLDVDISALLSFTNIQTQEWYQALQSQALLTPVGKIGNTYFMSAHEEMCHIWKSLMTVFDPLSWSRCTRGQLESFRSEIQDNLDIRYTKSGRVWRLSFNFINDDMMPSSHITISTLGWLFQSIHWDLEDSWWEMVFSGRYLAGESLHVDYSSDFWWSTSEFNSEFTFWENSLDSMNIMWEYQDSWSKISSYLELQNGEIRGSVIGSESDEDFINCDMHWNLSENYFNMEWSCLVEGISEIIEIHGSIEYDTRDNKNNFDFFIDGQIDWEDFMEIRLKNTAIREIIDNLQIQTPTSTVDIEDVFESMPALDDIFFWATHEWDDSWEWELNYDIEHNQWSNYDETCYIYNNGDTYCYKNYDDGSSETCIDSSETTWESYCNRITEAYYYDWGLDIYYYDTYMIDGKTGERTDY